MAQSFLSCESSIIDEIHRYAITTSISSVSAINSPYLRDSAALTASASSRFSNSLISRNLKTVSRSRRSRWV